MSEPSQNQAGLPFVLLALTAVTGVVDAVSFLGLGHVFTANMTGNIVFLGFAIGGAPDVAVPRSLLALFCFGTGAAIGGWMTGWIESKRWAAIAFGIESILLLLSAAIAVGLKPSYEADLVRVQGLIASTAMAMGLRNAIVRKLAVPDLTTTVLTMTVTGLAADSPFGGSENPRWLWRCGAVAAMVCGAAAGALMLRQSIALPFFACAMITAGAALATFQIQSKERLKA